MMPLQCNRKLEAKAVSAKLNSKKRYPGIRLAIANLYQSAIAISTVYRIYDASGGCGVRPGIALFRYHRNET